MIEFIHYVDENYASNKIYFDDELEVAIFINTHEKAFFIDCPCKNFFLEVEGFFREFKMQYIINYEQSFIDELEDELGCGDYDDEEYELKRVLRFVKEEM